MIAHKSNEDNDKPSKHPHKATRVKALKKIGVSEDDVKTAQRLLATIPPINYGKKVEKVLGYSDAQIKREKAVKVLGTCEQDIELEVSKCLGALGLDGRRRSLLQYANRKNKAFLMENYQENKNDKNRRNTMPNLSTSRKNTLASIKINNSKQRKFNSVAFTPNKSKEESSLFSSSSILSSPDKENIHSNGNNKSDASSKRISFEPSVL